MSPVIVVLVFLLALFGRLPYMAGDLPLTRAERTRYEETSRYDEVIQFLSDLQKLSPLLRVETFGRSVEGRALPLLILADPPFSTPREAAASGKPVVFVMANIHAGEVEGKEAALHFARRVLAGDQRRLLDKIVLLIAPIYNADGNEKVSVQNRTAQYGPIGGVGVRENAQGLDLNRDYVKMEAPETRALIRLFNRWDPHLTLDLHTTNGSYHGYHLTYSVPLNPTVDGNILSYHRDKMMPAIEKAMLARHKFRTYYYGNFSGRTPRPGEPDRRSWQPFIHQPRIGQNYVGFRNRLTILSEAYSYLDFKRRIEVTEALIEETCKYAAAHGGEIRKLAQRADEETVRRGLNGPPVQVGVAYETRPLPNPVEILIGEVKKVLNPQSGREMTATVEDKITRVKMLDYGTYAATRNVPAAFAYLLPPEPELSAAVGKLIDHGITVEELTAPLTAEVDDFLIENVNRAERLFQGHREVKLTGRFQKETVTFPTGTVLVRTAQPLGVLAAYLLEPESDDGLVTWNFLDPLLAPGKVFPVHKLMRATSVPSRILQRDTFKAGVGPIVSILPDKGARTHEE
jgi:hypothetical protein